jgi:hypothetical protein
MGKVSKGGNKLPQTAAFPFYLQNWQQMHCRYCKQFMMSELCPSPWYFNDITISRAVKNQDICPTVKVYAIME